MASSNIFDGMNITSVADEVQHLDFMHRMLQKTAEQTVFTGNSPSTSSPPPSVETAGGSIAFCGDTETAGGMGITQPDLKTSFGGNVETTGGIAFQGNSEVVTTAAETGTQTTDIFSESQRQRRRGEYLVNEAHDLNHRAMIARTQGDYASADELQRMANAMQQEGYDILERLQTRNMNSGRDISFGGLSRCEKACAEKADGWRNTYILGHW